MSVGSTSHLEFHLQQDMDRLRSRVSELGAMAGRAVSRATAALLDGNLVDAQAVILRDRLIDRLERDGERLGLEMLIRHQPLGRTLRFIHASLRILGELERIGDYAESIARQALRIQRFDPAPSLPRFGEQAAMASDMLTRAIRAYRTEDIQLARETIPIEEAADQLRDVVRNELLERNQAGTFSVSALTTLLTVARRLERVTDQAKSICEEVVFICSGETVRHPRAENLRVLFIDDTNASLGHLAEAVARRHADDRFEFFSAGMRPLPPDPRTRDFLQRKGVNVSNLVSRSLGQVPPPEEQDLIIALAESGQQVFPMSSSRTLCLHWPITDPTTFHDEAASKAAYETAWQTLEQRLTPLIEAVGRD